MSRSPNAWRAMPAARVPSSLELGRLFLDHFDPGNSLVDLGCGRGITLARLAGRGFGRLYGLDLNPAVLQEAHRALNGQGFRVPLACAGLGALPFLAGRFQGALMMAVLTVLPRARARARALRQAARVLAPHGRLYVADFALNDDLPLYRDRYQEGALLGLEPGQFPVRGPDGRTMFLARHFTGPELEEMLSLAGFGILAHEEPQVTTRTGKQVRGRIIVGQKIQ